jgi:outer membrane receptor for ferrienterochelin and colicin
VLAVSVFHKRFHDPIEAVIIPTGRGVVTYENAMGALNTGVELEARKGLDFLTPVMKDFSVLGNVTFVHSRVELDPAKGGTQTSTERPLAGQSPYVLNLALDWMHEATRTRARVLYNVQGERIAQVGTQGLPDIYEQPRHLVDLSVAQGLGDHFDLKLTIDNILDAPVKLLQNETMVGSYRVGRTAWLSATYTY